MRLILVLTALWLCFAIPAAAQDHQTDFGTFNFERELGTMSGVVAASPDSVFLAVGVILGDLGLTIKDVDSTNREMGATRAKLFRRVGKRPVSYYLSCGDGMTGPNADNWHVFLNLGVRVSAAPNHRAKLVMSVNADAIDVPNGRSDRLPCATTGQLELELLRRLRQLFPGTA